MISSGRCFDFGAPPTEPLRKVLPHLLADFPRVVTSRALSIYLAIAGLSMFSWDFRFGFFSRCLGTVQRQEAMASQEIRCVSCSKHLIPDS
jgi:hypothetical protein